MKPDAMGDEADRFETELAKFIEKFLVDLRAARARLDQIHDQIFALDQVRPDLILLRRGVADHRRAANARQIAVFLAEDLHANQIAALQFAISRTDIGKLTALP